jgi:ATP-dependent RNA helicase DeaD
MPTFDELGLAPEIVESLLTEGIENPTSLQVHAIPVLARGNSAVIRAGAGAGALLAWGTALLHRIEPGAGAPGAIVLVPTREAALEVARSLGRIGLGTGHRCAALEGPFALPGHADVLVATPEGLGSGLHTAEVRTASVRSLVIDGAGVILPHAAAEVESVLEFLSGQELQTIVVSDPLTPAVRSFIDSHVKRSVFLPPEAAGDDSPAAPVERGILQVVTADGRSLEEALLALLADRLNDPVRHALLYFQTEDRAADVADLLALHGFASGPPGDPDVPIWLGTNPLDARQRLRDSEIVADAVVTLSTDVPADADALDRRHGGHTGTNLVVAAPRELPHLRRAALEAGYRLEEVSLREAPRDRGADFLARIEEALHAEDLGAYLTLLDPLFERWTGPEVAAALAAILRSAAGGDGGEGRPSATSGRLVAAERGRPPAWAHLFLSIGKRDGVGPGDLVGAITGEAGLKGEQIGRIEVKESFSRVEVEDAHAHQVISALNGITIRGRSVRADFDRVEQRSTESAARGKPGGPGGPGSRGRPSTQGGSARPSAGRPHRKGSS